jgi:hypothetical protein
MEEEDVGLLPFGTMAVSLVMMTALSCYMACNAYVR